MRKAIIILFILLYSCKDDKITKTASKNEVLNKKNEVVFIISDTIKSFFTNIYVNDLQEKPDLLFLGENHNKTSVVIPTEQTIKLLGGDPTISYSYKIDFEKGDSVFINFEKIKITKNKTVEIPVFDIINNKGKFSEINFESILLKENIKTKAIEIDTENFINTKWDAKNIFDNSINVLNNLKQSKSISTEFYTSRRLYQKLLFATITILQSKENTIDFEKFGIPLNDENQLKNEDYTDYLKTVITSKYFKGKNNIDFSTKFDFIKDNQTFLNENTKMAVLSSYLNNILTDDKGNFEQYFKKFDEINTDQNLKNKWKEINSEIKIKNDELNKKNRTIGILTTLVDNNKSNFEEVLAKHKGKIILVDFWASWCSPCREQMSSIKDLKLKFNKNEFQVVKISIDKDYDAWVRASKVENLSKDENSFIISDWKNSTIYKNFNINTIPRYLLFDKEGKILNDDAPNPLDSNLEKMIRKAI
ncbi:thioredoxin-like domain-containing protein [Flavobacterium ardleyense]|uniref:Thioredoxin-like domain-containing protein n=1 Tax=Flavobacterium ardleyense TaxID=2038737 RepID=A0ABW5ZAP1_9FLAO